MKKPNLSEKKAQKKSQYYEDDVISLADIVLIFARQLRVIIFLPAILCILMIIYVIFFSTPIYRSTSKIMSSSSSGVSQAAGFAAQLGINIPSKQSEPKWVYPEILTSRTLAKAVLMKKINTTEFGPDKTLLQILAHGSNSPQLDLEKLEIIGVEKLLKMINVSEDVKTSIVTLSVNATEARLAATLNTVLIEELDAYQRKYNKAKTSETKQFIEERIIDVEKELVAAEEYLRVFMDRNRRIENSPALQLEKQRLGREVTVLTGVFTTLKQQLETTKIEEVKESDYIVILDKPEIPLHPYKPNKSRMVILSGIFGIALGILIAYIREYANNSEKEEKDKLNEAKSIIWKNILGFIHKNNN